MNNRYKTNLRLSRLIDKGALTENLVTGSKRRYNDTVVQQLLSFRFAEERLNVGVYGITVCAIRMGQVPERRGKLLRQAGWDSAALDNRLHCSYRETVK